LKPWLCLPRAWANVAATPAGVDDGSSYSPGRETRPGANGCDPFGIENAIHPPGITDCNFCRVHSSLGKPPAMKAGLTDHA